MFCLSTGGRGYPCSLVPGLRSFPSGVSWWRVTQSGPRTGVPLPLTDKTRHETGYYAGVMPLLLSQRRAFFFFFNLAALLIIYDNPKIHNRVLHCMKAVCLILCTCVPAKHRTHGLPSDYFQGKKLTALLTDHIVYWIIVAVIESPGPN